MKKLLHTPASLILASLMICTVINTKAQVNYKYSFFYTNPVFNHLLSGTTLDTIGSADTLWAGIDIGFTFKFNCADYTQLGVSSNGFIWFGSNAPSATEYHPVSSSAACDGIVSAYGANLKKSTSGGTGTPYKISYQTTGTAPNRIFTVEWNHTAVTTNTSNPFDLQIKLYEGTDKISILIWDHPYFITGSNTFGQVGIRGVSNTDFANRKITNNNNWCNSLAGTNNNDSAAIILTFPCYYASSANGQAVCYTYSPIGCDGNWNIRGKIWYDTDGDCATDSAEPVLNNIKVKLYDSGNNLVGQIYSFGNGSYYFNVPYGTYTVRVDTTNTPYSVLCPDTALQVAIISATDSIADSLNFRLVCRPGYDLGIKALYQSAGRIRPAKTATITAVAGDLSNYFGTHCNTAGLSGTVMIVIDGHGHYISMAGGPTPASTSGDSLIWNVTDFSQFSSYVRFNIRIDTTAHIGDSICIQITVTGNSGTDTKPSNNTYTRCFVVRSSVDPNEKEVDKDIVHQGGEWLVYDTHFENTGNAPAENVLVSDTLDPSLDVSTFEWITSNYPAVTKISKEGVVSFEFINIQLPDSATDPSLAQGFIQYRIKMKDNITPGTIAYNHSAIYFDFNPPMLTNTATTVYEIATGSKETEKGNVVSIYPNPASKSVIINCTGELKNASAVIYDLSGREMVSMPVQTGRNSVSLESLSTGYYLVQVMAGKTVIAINKLAVMK